MLKFNKQHKVKLPAKMVKVAAELGNAEQVGKYLSDIVRFTLQRLPTDKRAQAVDNLKTKFLNLNETDISSKHLPLSSALGQSITFVKHILFNHDANYVRGVLDSLERHVPVIVRFREVVPGKLYRGSAPTPDDVVSLHEKLGVRKIVSLDEKTGDRIERACRLLGIRHVKEYLYGRQKIASSFSFPGSVPTFSE